MPYLSKLCQTELPHRAKLVYTHLRDWQYKEFKAFPDIETMIAAPSMSHSTTKLAIKDLETSPSLGHYHENGNAIFYRLYPILK